MSAVLSELAVAPAADHMPTTTMSGPVRSRRVTTRQTFPVGARFPRRSAAERVARSATVTSTAVHAPVFPVGARFPRRSTADAVLYLAELATTGERPTGFAAPTHPVGARFPRRSTANLGLALAG